MKFDRHICGFIPVIIVVIGICANTHAERIERDLHRDYVVRIQRSLRDFRRSLPQPWDPAILSNEPIFRRPDARRYASQLCAHLFDANSPRAREAEKVWARDFHAGKFQSSDWGLYWAGYEAVVPSSRGYDEIVRTADRVLPTSGLIMDFGSGPGITSTKLWFYRNARGSQQARYLLIDANEPALQRAVAKQHSLAIPEQQLKVIKGDLLRNRYHDQLYKPVGSGALLINTLYTLGDKPSRGKFLGLVKRNLKPGAPVVIVDLDPRITISENLYPLMDELAQEAVHYESEMTDGDLAIEVVSNLHGLLSGDKREKLSTRAELVEQVEQGGLEIVEPPRLTYGGVSNILVARVPRGN